MKMYAAALVFNLLLPGSVHAQVPQLIRYQGTLVDSNNVPLEGSHALTFRIYSASTGGSAIWTEAQSGVPVSRGTFNVLLGQVTPLTVAFEKDYWLSVQVDSDTEMNPRQRLTSVPYAYRAKVAEALDTSPRFTVDTSGALTDSLVAYWKLDEAAGTRKDSKGTNSLTDLNTVTQAAGKAGKAAQFTAANQQYLSLADNPSLSTGDVDFTIAAWVYLDSKLTDIMTIASKQDPDDGAPYTQAEWALHYFNFSSADRFRFEIRGTDIVTANNAGAPSTGAWHLVIAWHDAAANTLNIQVNNGAVNSANTTTAPSDSAQPFNIGGQQRTGGATFRFWNGRIDEVGFWKRVLTPQERTDLYNAGQGNTYLPGLVVPHSQQAEEAKRLVETPAHFSPDATGALANNLITYWKLDEASGTRNDSQGANALTDQNAVTQATGRVGQAGQFASASSKYLRVADNASLSVGDLDFTWAGWFYMDTHPAAGTDRPLISKGGLGDTGKEGYSIKVMRNGANTATTMTFIVGNGASSHGRLNSAVNLATGTWYFFAAVHDSMNNQLRLMINGSTETESWSGGGHDDACEVTIGAGYFGGGTCAPPTSYWNGRIDELGFWKRALTAQEQVDLYNTSSGNTLLPGGFFMDSLLTGKRHRLVTEELP